MVTTAAPESSPNIHARSRGWTAQPGPQSHLIECPVEDLFYGGARGGGKTDGLLGDFLNHQARWGGQAKGIMFRKTYKQLQKHVEPRAKEIYNQYGATYKHDTRRFTFPNGATLELAYARTITDAEEYQGSSYTWQGWEELTNWPSPKVYDKLYPTLRSAHGIKCKRRATGNPGGPGHNWVKQRYIDPVQPYQIHVWEPDGAQIKTTFIPARLEDNQILMKNDPDYEQRILSAPGQLGKAWRYGIWDIVSGSFFGDIWERDEHVISPVEDPNKYEITRSYDWGSSKPSATIWWVKAPGEEIELKSGQKICPPRGSLIAQNEFYTWNGNPNEGNRMTSREQAKEIREFEDARGWGVRPGPADSSIFDVKDGECIADKMAKQDITWEPADKGPGSRINGWESMRDMLKSATDHPAEDPALYLSDNCRHGIRTLPTLPADDRKPEDVDTESEDHWADAARYRVTWKPKPKGGGSADVGGF